ncbi:hypothetical protein HR45_04065 [Shewanella mangrovi]|uniref:Uncharacterized protein n=1 Tax=Shewanella mangrovi TaxID=1515746 RepID=A0A094JH93_9GAMM|nr:hypothetical protein [Shewanella mangrovi]KFZ38607.1 hypothetical protein HR45_04065 [Shewanella mangrovi]
MIWSLAVVVVIVVAFIFLRPSKADEYNIGPEQLQALLEKLCLSEEGAWMSVMFMPGGQLDFGKGQDFLSLSFAIDAPEQERNKLSAIDSFSNLGLEAQETETNGFKHLECKLPLNHGQASTYALSIINSLRGESAEPFIAIPEGFDYKEVMEKS